mmetsp:Transcript_38408/g.75609  ORF Transcript_38408/g.75609 Transcript_38408/m.75609 type:complete len:405 (+) Transcript_38408:141-1355(+)
MKSLRCFLEESIVTTAQTGSPVRGTTTSCATSMQTPCGKRQSQPKRQKILWSTCKRLRQGLYVMKVTLMLSTTQKKTGAPDEPPPKPREPVERPESPTPAAGQAPAAASRERKPKPSYFWPTSHGRDYHLISNRYLQRDADQRAQNEHQQAKEQAAVKFFETNRYNPVVGNFYDPDEEYRFQVERKAASFEHGKDVICRGPPHFQSAEGLVYNILAPQIPKDPRTLAEADAKQRERESYPRLSSVFENGLQARMDAKRAAQRARAMNRSSEQRYDEIVNKGYNILTNEPFKGRLGRPYPERRGRVKVPETQPYMGLDYSGQQKSAQPSAQATPQQQSPRSATQKQFDQQYSQQFDTTYTQSPTQLSPTQQQFAAQGRRSRPQSGEVTPDRTVRFNPVEQEFGAE